MKNLKYLLVLMSTLFLSTAWSARHYEEIIADLLTQKELIDEQVKLVNDADKAERALTGYELNLISITTAERMKVRAEAYAFFERSRYLLQGKKYKEGKISKYALKELIKSLSVATTLFDIGLYSHQVFNKSKRLRQILNEEDTSYDRQGYTFSQSTKNAFRIRNRKHLNRALHIYETKFLTTPEFAQDPDLSVAQYMIDRSYYKTNVQQKGRLGFLGELFPVIIGKLSLSLVNRRDQFTGIGKRIINGGSMLFGNLVGGVQKRLGKLYLDEKFIHETEVRLRPLDILFEKTPFRLTDQFIPGYWGHTAIYLGTIEELIDLGLWDHPLVEKHKYMIEDGQLIVEALRPGVKMSSLEEFSNIDDFAVLRHKVAMTKQEQIEHILRALSHVGKKYDFNFDVETGRTIVCSELPYRTYTNLKFKTTRMLSRNTISVDEVAELGLTGGVLEPVILYVDGKEIHGAEIQTTFDNLFKKAEKARKEAEAEMQLLLHK